MVLSRTARATLPALVLVVMTGCLEVTQEVKLHRNGALDLTLTFSTDTELRDRLQLLGSERLQDLEELMALVETMSNEASCRDWFEQRRATLTKHVSELRGGRQVVRLEVKTADFRHLLASAGAEGKVLLFGFAQGPGPQIGELVIGGHLPPSLREVLEVGARLQEKQRDMVLDTARTFTRGSKISVRVELPGVILKSEVPRQGDSSVLLALDFSRWKTAEDLENLFARRRATWDAAGIGFELPRPAAQPPVTPRSRAATPQSRPIAPQSRPSNRPSVRP